MKFLCDSGRKSPPNGKKKTGVLALINFYPRLKNLGNIMKKLRKSFPVKKK